LPFVPGSRNEPYWLRATRLVDRLYSAYCALRDEIALAYVRPQAWRAVVLERYSQRTPFYRDEAYQATGLFPWESEAVARWFPTPPATILIGGAGAGRETLALTRLGYGVAAFEPTPLLFQALRDHLTQAGIEAPIALASYEDLVDALDTPLTSVTPPTSLQLLCREKSYDAVVLGLGSFSYCAGADTRDRLLRAIGHLCPQGPILLSFERHLPAAGRAARLARLLRRCLRFAPGSRLVAEGDQLGETGFEHAFTDCELDVLARSTGYRVAQIRHSPAPHAVLVRDVCETSHSEPS
jgi:hypothetical protein